MKRILINATQNEEIRVALCKGNHLYDFDLENRTREQKKSNIYKGHVTRVEPSLEAVFVEYGSQRQGFLPIREISNEYLSGNPRDENIKKLIKEGDELIVQVEKEERGNKGAALSTYVSLAGRYLVLMPNNPRGGGISRQISGKLREDMKRMLGNLDLPKGMSVIIRTAGIGKTQEDLQHDLNHLLNIWQAIQEQNKKYPSPRLVHQEAGVVTRAVRDYLRDDISEIWIDNENAYIEAAGFIDAVMPTQADKLRKYTDYEPMFARFNVEKQIETAYQREVRLPSGGSIVIDQTEALVSIDINSAKSTKGSDVAATAYHTNLEAADEIARQLRLRDMGGLIVIDFIDMSDNKHQKEVEKRLVDATKYDRARVQFGEISKFGLMEMSRQRLRPSLEESTGYICPRCHGNGMIRDLRSLSLAIMRQIEQIALKERQGEVQAEVPTDIAAFILNEKRDSLVYLEQDSGTRITILPHAHLESPNFKLHFNRDGFAPTSYERITDTQQQEHSDLGYDVDWQTAEKERPEQQPTRQPRKIADNQGGQDTQTDNRANPTVETHRSQSAPVVSARAAHDNNAQGEQAPSITTKAAVTAQPQAVAWLSNLFAQAPQAQTTPNVNSHAAAEAIEAIVNTGAQSLGAFGQVDYSALDSVQDAKPTSPEKNAQKEVDNTQDPQAKRQADSDEDQKDSHADDRRKRKTRKSRSPKARQRKEQRHESDSVQNRSDDSVDNRSDHTDKSPSSDQDKHANKRQDDSSTDQPHAKRKLHSQRSSRGKLERGETLTTDDTAKPTDQQATAKSATKDKPDHKAQGHRAQRQQDSSQDPNEITLQINEAPVKLKVPEVVHLSLDDSKPEKTSQKPSEDKNAEPQKVDTSVQKPAAQAKTADEVALTTDAKSQSTTSDKEAETTTATEDHTAATADEKSDEANRPVADSAESKANITNTDDSEAQDNRAFTLDHGALFAERYVTADKFAQASNDPRVVRQQQSAIKAEKGEQVTTTSTVVAAVRGTVGELIHATLTDAQNRLAKDGVIRCFIDAIEAHKQQAESVSVERDETATATEDFNFSNYGYQPLDADYLTNFKAMTQAVSEFSIAQGKTEVEPRPIGKRASNDPRGQHPDYDMKAAQVEEAPAKLSDQSDEPSQSGVEEQDSSQGENQEIEATDTEATALTDEAQVTSVSAESEHLLEAAQDADVESDEESSKEDSQSGKSKTTIASYKNMIENVAEQLLPQTSMFNLTTPKVPKARSRKPKTEHKKPTQVEQAAAEANNFSSDSASSNNANNES